MQALIINQSKIKMPFEEISFVIYDQYLAETFRSINRMTVCPYVANYASSSPISLIANLHPFYVVSRITTFVLSLCTAFASWRKFIVPSYYNFLLHIHFLPHNVHRDTYVDTLAIYKERFICDSRGQSGAESTISDMLKINSHRSFPQHPLLHFAAAAG